MGYCIQKHTMRLRQTGEPAPGIRALHKHTRAMRSPTHHRGRESCSLVCCPYSPLFQGRAGIFFVSSIAAPTLHPSLVCGRGKKDRTYRVTSLNVIFVGGAAARGGEGAALSDREVSARKKKPGGFFRRATGRCGVRLCGGALSFHPFFLARRKKGWRPLVA